MKFKLLNILLIASIYCNAQVISFRPGIGWGKPSMANNINIISGNPIDANNNAVFYSGIKAKNLVDPQTSYMLELDLSKKSRIGIGRMTGISATSYASIIKGFTHPIQTYHVTKFYKWGLEYTYTTKFLKKNRISFLGSVWYLNNNISGPWALIFLGKDQNNITTDSSYNYGSNVNKRGGMVSTGLRYTIINFKKQRESVSFTLLYDYSFSYLNNAYTNMYYDNLSKSLLISSTAKGNQIKLYISMPIKIVDLKKREIWPYN